jgi:tetratricopeptide (TPR) repeat protein
MKKLLTVFIVLVFFSVSFAQISSNVQKNMYYGYFNTAVVLLQNGIKANPANLENYYALGALYARLNKIDSAKIVFNKLIEVNPKAPISTVAQGYIALNDNKKDEAKATFERAVKATKSKDGAIMRNIGEAFEYSPKKDILLAIEYLKRAIAIEIKNPDTYFSLGEAYLANNESGPAVTQYEFCSDYDKTAAWAYTRIGQIFKSAKNYPKANEAFEAAMKADPEYPYIYKEMADWKYLYNDYPAAVKNFEIYQNKTGDNSIEARTLKSTYFFYNKNYKGTIELVNEIMKKDSSKNYMIRLLGYSSFEQGDSIQAKNYMEKFFQKTPTDKILWSDHFYLGKIYYKLGQEQDALNQFTKAIALDSTKADIYQELALHNFGKGNYKDAGFWYAKKLSKLEKPGLQNYFDIAFAYYKAEEYATANIYFEKIVTKWPTSMTGLLYHARSNAYLDPQSTQALAKPNYEKIVIQGETDPIKYKNELKEAYKYLYYHFYNIPDKATALTFADKYIKIDPNDAEGIQMMDAVK